MGIITFSFQKMKLSALHLAVLGYSEALDRKVYGECAVDDPINRTLKGRHERSEDMTIQKCIYTCSIYGYDYAGLEYHDECYCGDKPDGGFVWTWQDRCSAACVGDRRQDCGGSDSLSIYSTVSPYWPDGQCMNDFPENRRVLNDYAVIGDDTMTVEKCSDYCWDLMGWYGYYGVENGKDCWCGESDSDKKFLPTHQNQCDTPCSGDDSELCGGSNYRINVYAQWWFENDSPVFANDIDPATFNPKGACYKDSESLFTYQAPNTDLDVEKCRATCREQDPVLQYTGVGKKLNESTGDEEFTCFCGPDAPSSTNLRAKEECSFLCPGDADYFCGGPNARLNIWETGTDA